MPEAERVLGPSPGVDKGPSIEQAFDVEAEQATSSVHTLGPDSSARSDGRSSKPQPPGPESRPYVAFETEWGMSIVGRSEIALRSEIIEPFVGQVDLVLTSPPFPLNRKKEYGNFNGKEYVEWLAAFAPELRRMLKPTGSLVLEIGNAWEPGRPVMSTFTFKALLAFLEAGDFSLCQQFICHNPARLPSPVQWVNVERIRVKDSFTNVWWMSTTDRPDADNRRVLQPYSAAMKSLLAGGHYNSGRRPSDHSIGESSFLTDNGGAIPPNVIVAANTHSADGYQRYCRDKGIPLHPARMPRSLVEFFVQFLTKPDGLVLDPFAGSNTTGAVAEAQGRRWIAIEADPEYVRGSRGHFALRHRPNTVARRERLEA